MTGYDWKLIGLRLNHEWFIATNSYKYKEIQQFEYIT